MVGFSEVVSSVIYMLWLYSDSCNVSMYKVCRVNWPLPRGKSVCLLKGGQCPRMCDRVPWSNCPLLLWSRPLTNHPATFHICCMSASARRAHPSRTLPASLHYACCWTGRTVFTITKQCCWPCLRLDVLKHHFYIMPKSFGIMLSVQCFWHLHWMSTAIWFQFFCVHVFHRIQIVWQVLCNLFLDKS